MQNKVWNNLHLFCIGVVILNTNVDGDHRNGALSPDNIQVINTASGTYISFGSLYPIHRWKLLENFSRD